MSKTGRVGDMEWLTHCKKTLEWALHMIPFTHCLQGGGQVFYGAILSLLIELPANEAAGKILAEHFYDSDNLDPEIQDRLQCLLKEWQGVFLDEQPKLRQRESSNSDSGLIESPRGLTLSLYYQKQAQKVETLLTRKNRTFGKFDEFVFASHLEMDNANDFEDDGVGCIGSRPFESTEEYLQFLDEFYAVSFHQIMDAEKENKCETSTALLLEYSDQIRSHEINSLTHRAVSSLQRKQGGLNVVTITSPRGITSLRGRTFTPIKVKVKKSGTPQLPPHPSKKGGLFRSRSFSDISKIKPKKKVVAPEKDENLNNSWLGGTLTSELQPTKTHILAAPDGRVSRQLPKIPPFILKGDSKLERSLSVSDIQKQLIPEEILDGDSADTMDPLSTPVVPEWLLDNMKYASKWNNTEQLLQWLFRWSNRNHTLVDRKHYPQNSPRATEPGTSQMKMSSALKIRVPPRMVMYSLWLLENVYYPDPSYASQAHIPTEPVETTVAVATNGRQGAESPQPGPSGRGVTPPPPDTGRSDFTNITEFSDNITVSAVDEHEHRRRAKKEKKKKKEKKREKKQTDNMPVEPEVRTNALEKKTVRKLSFKLPEPDIESRQSR